MRERPVATYVVEGMSCGHCASSVKQEVAEVEGVADAAVDLATGRLEVMGEGFTDEQVSSAVDQAGYRIAARV